MDINKELEDLKKQFTPVSAMKFITGTVISLGATAAVVAMFKNSLIGAKGITKLMMRLGIFALGCKAGDIAEKYFNDTIDELSKTFNEAKKEMDNE